MKMIMYGAPICSECVIAKEALAGKSDIELDYRNIVETTANLKEFLKYRDVEPMFDEIKKEGRIGIPFFILEDGTKTFDITSYVNVELKKETNQTNFCSLDGKGNC